MIEIDTSVAHASRVYDYLLGGTTNFEVDRAAAGFLAEAIGGHDVASAHVRATATSWCGPCAAWSTRASASSSTSA